MLGFCDEYRLNERLKAGVFSSEFKIRPVSDNEDATPKFACQVGGAEVGGLAGEAGGAGRRRPRGGAPPRRKITEHCSMPVF